MRGDAGFGGEDEFGLFPSGQRDFLSVIGQVACDKNGFANQHEPAGILIVFHLDPVDAAIAQRGMGAAESDQRAMPFQQLPVGLRLQLVPIELRGEEGLAGLRRGDFAGVPAKGAEFFNAPFLHGLGQVRSGVIGEVLEGSLGPPFFPLKQHRHKGRRKDKGSADLQLARRQQVTGPFAERAIAYLVVVLQARHERVA